MNFKVNKIRKGEIKGRVKDEKEYGEVNLTKKILKIKIPILISLLIAILLIVIYYT